MNNKKSIIVNIDSGLVGFWLSIASILSNNYNIVVITRNSFRKGIVDNVIPGVYSNIEVKEDFFREFVRQGMSKEEIIKQAVSVEDKYGVACSMLIAHQRGIGKGYIFNVDRHPDMYKTLWAHEQKLMEVLKELFFCEYIVAKYKPVLFLSNLHMKELSLVTRHNKIRYLSLGFARYGNRMMWIENEYYQNYDLIKKVKKYVKKYTKTHNSSKINYVQYARAELVISMQSNTYTAAFKKALGRLPGEIERFVTGYHKKTQGYKFMRWYGPIFRRPFSFKYLEKHGKKIDELRGYKLFFYPMHMEPEYVGLSVVPEFSNSMELIAWLSKSIPADGILVVKEHPQSFGVRSRYYYDRFRKMANVVLAHPETSSQEWIKSSLLVSVLAGTVGIEAVYSEKPVLTFGKYNIVNNLPTVRYASNYDSTKQAVDELIELSNNKKLLRVSKQALYHAQKDVSFEMPGLEKEKLWKSNTQNMDMVMIAVESLKEKYNI